MNIRITGASVCITGSYILMGSHGQCVILDMSRAVSIPEIHQQLVPLCRDYRLYAGISSPVTGIRELHASWITF